MAELKQAELGMPVADLIRQLSIGGFNRSKKLYAGRRSQFIQHGSTERSSPKPYWGLTNHSGDRLVSKKAFSIAEIRNSKVHEGPDFRRKLAAVQTGKRKTVRRSVEIEFLQHTYQATLLNIVANKRKRQQCDTHFLQRRCTRGFWVWRLQHAAAVRNRTMSYPISKLPISLRAPRQFQ